MGLFGKEDLYTPTRVAKLEQEVRWLKERIELLERKCQPPRQPTLVWFYPGTLSIKTEVLLLDVIYALLEYLQLDITRLPERVEITKAKK